MINKTKIEDKLEKERQSSNNYSKTQNKVSARIVVDKYKHKKKMKLKLHSTDLQKEQSKQTYKKI